jgi:chemotaxis signal transduction protein
MSQAATANQTNIAGSYLTFHLSQAKYALPVDAIQYITTRDAIDPHDIPRGKSEQSRIFTFQEEQISLYNFSGLIGSASQIEECQALIDMLDQRKQDHLDWMEALEASLESGTEFTKAKDPHQCAFGRWYDHYHTNDEELRAIMVQFDEPHKRIHSLAENLLSMVKDENKVAEALRILNDERHSTLKQLLRLFGQAKSRLSDMLKPVVVILHANDRSYAVELDSIDQIMEFNNSHWLPGKEQDLKHPCYDGFLQKTEGELYIRLEPAHLIT